MSPIHSPAAFAAAAFALLCIPGPTNILLARAGERDGLAAARRLLPVVAGAYLAGIGAVHGLVVLLPGLPVARLLNAAAAVWLAAIAVRLWRTPIGPEARPAGVGALLGTTLANPKTALFATLVIPSDHFVGGVLMLVPLILAVGTGYLVLGAGLMRLRCSPVALSRGSAAALLGFAGLAIGAAASA